MSECLKENDSTMSLTSTPLASTGSITTSERVLRTALSPVQNLGSIIKKEKQKLSLKGITNLPNSCSILAENAKQGMSIDDGKENSSTSSAKLRSHLPRPPQHNGQVKKKYFPVTSSGYGKGTRLRRSNSFNTVNRLSKCDTDDEGSVGSRSRSLSRERQRRPSSAPSSPASMAKSIITSSTGRNQNKLWGEQQRLWRKERQNLSKSKIEKEGKKRPTPSSSTQHTTPSMPQKSTKRSENSTPNSISSCRYDGSVPKNDGTSGNGTSTPTLSPVKNSTSKIIAGWRSNTPGKSPPRSSSRSWSAVAATPGRIAIQTSEIKQLSDKLFGEGTDLSDDIVRKALNTKQSTGARQWELKKKLENANSAIKKLKELLNSLLQAKNKLVRDSIAVEKTVRERFERAMQKLQTLEAESDMLRNKQKQALADNTILQDNVKDKERELRQSEEKIRSLSMEVAGLKDALASAETARSQADIALGIAQGRLEDFDKQAEGWRNEILNVEAGKAKAVKTAEMAIHSALEKEMTELRDECAALRTKMQSREEELGRLIDVGGDSSTSGSTDGGGNNLSDVKRELDRLRERVSEVESQLALREAELTRAVADSEAAASRLSAKDKDMSELMKSLGDIQRSGQAREEEAKMLRKAAEERAVELERLVSESRGEISVMQHEKTTLSSNLSAARSDLSTAQTCVDNLKKEIAELKLKCNTHDAALQVEKELRSRAEEMEQEERRERIAYSAQMVAMTKEHVKVEASLKEANESLERNWRDKLDTERGKTSLKEQELADAKETIAGLEGERKSLIEELNDKKSMADAKSVEEIGKLKGEIEVMKARLKEAERRATLFGMESEERVKHLEEQVREGQAERRRMHNTIQELRGNVRVFARVRPFLPGDGVDSDADPSVVPKNDTSLTIIKSDDQNQEYDFKFDRVFAPSTAQESIFQEVSEFIQSALDGYSVCLFSYGQTGSGKTHTMQGSGSGQMRGIIPRAIEQVGEYKQVLENQGWEYKMKVSFLEIYNETIRDLLRDESNSDTKHDIKVDSEGRRYVSDLTLKDLEPTDNAAVEEVMRQAAKYRSVASTDMNAVSSRSHSVFTLHLTAVHSKQRRGLRGTLNLVDLAGSERLDRSGATGDRAREAMAINKSLSSLTDVFAAIGKKASHVPFRNSKLTYLLQPSLSGDGKTLMMINLSPTEESFQESLCTLRFASQVNKCELGKPRRAIEDVGDDDSSKKNSKGNSRCVKRRVGK